MRLLVIADDLTGANDTGAQFAGAGLDTLVRTRWDAPPGRDAPVVVVNTASRHAPPAEAAARVRAVASGGTGVLYKKTDSVLRGNIAAELGALAALAGHVLYVPAFPRAGRTARDGIVHLHGTPVHETHFARDPLAPVRTSSIPELLTEAGCPVDHIPLEQLRGGSRLNPSPGPRITVVDGELETDLELTARLATGHPLAFAGPAGFANRMPALLGLAPGFRPLPSVTVPALAVSGSITPTTFEQIEVALAAGLTGFVPDPGALLTSGGTVALPSTNGTLLLHTCRSLADVDRYRALGRSLGIPDDALGPRVTHALAALAAELIRRHRYPTLVLLGGETSAAVLEAVDCTEYTLLGEQSTGVNFASAVIHGRLTMVITKSGGFGPPDLLVNLLR